MRRIIILSFIFLSLVAAPALAAEQINNFDVTININSDATVEVTETINYDFGAEPRHGIYRDIPVSYKARGGNYKLRLSVSSVTDQTGQPYNFTTSRQGRNLSLKIGDPTLEITGRHIYVIKYTVSRALNYFKDHDEFYWNVTGDQWSVPILQAQAAVFIPQQINSSDFQTACFAGPRGSTNPCFLADQLFGENLGQPNTTAFFSQSGLNSGEGLTIVVGFPKGIVTEPSWWQVAVEAIKDNWILALPIVVFLVLLYLWQHFGRDPEGRRTIIPQYDAPPYLTPSEVGAIIDERVDSRDVSADIINLAVKGYLKINQIEDKNILDKFSKNDNYILQKLKDAGGLSNEAERQLMKDLFKASYISTHEIGSQKIEGVKLSKLKDKFYKDLKEIKTQIYKDLVSKGYFLKNPQTVRGIYLGVGIIVAALGPIGGSVFGLFGVIAFMVSGALVIFFSFIMPQKTKAGVLAKEHILGLKDYLTVAEKDRLKFHNAPEKKPEVFEKLLPYAMVLKVEDEWAKQFEGIYKKQPDWYYSASGRSFNAIYLANSLSDFTATTNKALASTPRSASGGGSGFGGGGFSGGGFGGGGGGSW